MVGNDCFVLIDLIGLQVPKGDDLTVDEGTVFPGLDLGPLKRGEIEKIHRPGLIRGAFVSRKVYPDDIHFLALGGPDQLSEGIVDRRSIARKGILLLRRNGRIKNDTTRGRHADDAAVYQGDDPLPAAQQILLSLLHIGVIHGVGRKDAHIVIFKIRAQLLLDICKDAGIKGIVLPFHRAGVRFPGTKIDAAFPLVAKEKVPVRQDQVIPLPGVRGFQSFHIIDRRQIHRHDLRGTRRDLFIGKHRCAAQPGDLLLAKPLDQLYLGLEPKIPGRAVLYLNRNDAFPQICARKCQGISVQRRKDPVGKSGQEQEAEHHRRDQQDPPPGTGSGPLPGLTGFLLHGLKEEAVIDTAEGTG